MKSLPFSLCILLALLACEVQEELPELEPETMSPVNLVFQDIKVGDRLKYRFFYGSNYYSDENIRCYTNDTLIVEVLDIEEDKLIKLEEYLSPYSEIFEHPDSNYLWLNPAGSNFVNWETAEDFVKIYNADDPNSPSQSRLSFFFSSLEFDPAEKEEVFFTKWKPEPLIGNFCPELSIFDTDYQDVHVKVDNGPMAADGNGATIAYDENLGILRSMQYSAWTGQVQGWDRIP